MAASFEMNWIGTTIAPNREGAFDPQESAAISLLNQEGSTCRSAIRRPSSSFPLDEQGRTVVLHRLATYTRAALPNAVRAWFAGGPAASGALDPAATHVQRFGKGGGSTWRIFAEQTAKDERSDIDWRAFGTPTAHDE